MAKGGGDGGPNPFSLPPELQCFWLQEPAEEPVQERQLKVWEKPTFASKSASTRKLRDEDLAMAPIPPAIESALAAARGKVMEEERPDDTFLTTIATKPAVGLVEPLRKSEKDTRTYVQKKREVFLAHMACDNKRQEIVRLDQMAKAREDTLATSQQILDEDAKKFEIFLQGQILRAQQVTRDSEQKSKEKMDRLAKIKQIKQQIAGLQSESGKLREVRDECARYQDFLEKLTPQEWKEQQKQIKLDRKARRKARWIEERLRYTRERIKEEEKFMEKAVQEEVEAQKRRAGRSRRSQEEEDLVQKQRERDSRKKKMYRKLEEEERRLAAEYIEVSSDEDFEMYFKDPRQLMDSFTELEEVNLYLIQSSQETEQQVDEIRHTFEHMQKDMGGKVQALNDQIKQLRQSIAQEKKRRDDLRRSHSEKASTMVQDKKLGILTSKVQEIFTGCNLASDNYPDTLQMLGSIESKVEDLIQGLDEAYLQDSEMVMKLEWQKERERRDRVRENRSKEQMEKQEERLTTSLQRSQKPVFKKAGKQVMYRSPPLRQETKVVQDSTDDEAHARDHKVFSIYIDRKTNIPKTEPPVIEETRRIAANLADDVSSRAR